jgi:Tfp pilus assembly protein PilX
MINQQTQRGATLMVALIFLVMMTMFAISSINLSSVNLRIVNNMQSVKQMEAAVQDAVEQQISVSGNFARTNQSNFSGGNTYTEITPASIFFPGDTTLTVTGPTCIDSQVAVGYTAVVDDIIPQDNVFQVNASIIDAVTGTRVSLSQGIGVRMLAGNCVNAPECTSGDCGGF